MQNGNVKRITIVILAVSALFGAGFWYLTYESARIVGHKIARKIDSLPHGPRPIDNLPHNLSAPDH
jgi:hypothetical protein